jgi:hypothetical protein
MVVCEAGVARGRPIGLGLALSADLPWWGRPGLASDGDVSDLALAEAATLEVVLPADLVHFDTVLKGEMKG